MPPDLPPAILSDDVISLRAVSGSDWRLEQQLSRDPEIVRWTSYPLGMTAEEAQARVGRQQERARLGLTQRYTIRIDGRAVGTCGLGHLDHEVPEAMYALLGSARGRGLATRTLKILQHWGASHGRPHLDLVTVDGNVASAAVALRAGFVLTESFDGRHRDQPARLHRWHWRHRG